MTCTLLSFSIVQDQQETAAKLAKPSAYVMRVQIGTAVVAHDLARVSRLDTAQVEFHDNLEAGPQQMRELIEKGVEGMNLALSRQPTVRVRDRHHEQNTNGVVAREQVIFQLFRK